MSIIIYDCEIINAIPGKNGTKIEGIKYCEGWRDFPNMGVSVVGVYDYAENRYRVFCDDNRQEFHELLKTTDVYVGFNNIPFDNALLAASGWPVPHENYCYDLLREIWVSAGLGPDFIYPTHAGYGLDAVCQANFGTKKSGNGALAPVLWQQGRIGEVIDYCLNDIRLTKQLFDVVLKRGEIKDPKTGKLIKLRAA